MLPCFLSLLFMSPFTALTANDRTEATQKYLWGRWLLPSTSKEAQSESYSKVAALQAKDDECNFSAYNNGAWPLCCCCWDNTEWTCKQAMRYNNGSSTRRNTNDGAMDRTEQLHRSFSAPRDSSRANNKESTQEGWRWTVGNSMRGGWGAVSNL